MEKLIFISGAPGSGKNTQADFIAEELGYARFDTGDMVRRLIASGELDGSPLEAGFLMPMEKVLALAKRETQVILDSGAKGLVISGVPRSQEQAFGIGQEQGFVDWLDEKYGKQELVFIDLHITEEETLNRNLKRAEGRKDDNPDSLKIRIEEYRKETVPTFPDLKNRGYKVIDIDGMPSREEVFTNIKKSLKI